MIVVFLFLLLTVGSADDPLLTEPDRERALRFQRPGNFSPDPSNRYGQKSEAVRFGEVLFAEKGLSGDGQRSCATCHDPQLDFVDGEQHPRGLSKIPRDTPTLWDVAGQRWWGWDGRWDSLWMQALAPIESPEEMKGDRLLALRFIESRSELKRQYEQIFGAFPALEGLPRRSRDRLGPVPQWLALSKERRRELNRAFVNLGKAIAAFERTLVGPTTPFDQYLAALAAEDRAAAARYPEAARRGLQLFIGKAMCVSCHNGPLLSDGEFHDTGMLTSGPAAKDAGRYGGAQELQKNPFRSGGHYSDQPDAAGAKRTARLRRDPSMWGAFRTPPLRYLRRTAPYFHNGSAPDLETVVRFYSRRDGARPSTAGHGHQGETLLTALALTEEEERDLVRFLETLSPVASPTSE